MREDILSLMPKADFSRRSFIAGATVATGFAIAPGPVCANTVVITDTHGLTVGMGAVPAAGGAMPVYYAMPTSGGPFPTILVIQEIFGVHEHIKDICRRLAKLGYLAVAPELFFRHGDAAKAPDVPTILRDIAAKAADAQVMADLDATVAWATAMGKSYASRLAITGFCWGGRQTWLYAAHNPNLKAGIAWYGRLTGDYGPMAPRHPMDVAKDLKAPVLGLYGGADQGIPVSSVEDMRAELESARAKAEIVVYPEAPHGFHADYRPTFREEPARDGWKRLQEWLKRHGV